MGRFAPLTLAAEMVSTELALPAPGTMVAGEKEHVKALGRLPQVSATALLKAPD